MESPQEKNDRPKQLCTITIVFPVVSDDGALNVKKKIDLAVAETSDARVDFRIMNMGRPGV